MILGIPVVDAITVSNETPYPEKISPALQYFIIFNPVPSIHVGQSLEITGFSDAPDGTPFLLTGESFYYRMHSHQKGSDFTHDTFIFHGKIGNRTVDERGFSAEINTSSLRPDFYFIIVSVNEQSSNETQIRLESSKSQPTQEIIIDPLNSDYLIGDTIHFSGREQITEAKTIFVELVMDPVPRNLLQDNRTAFFVDDIPLEKSKNPGYLEFEDKIDTTNLYPGNYLLQVISFNQAEDGLFAINQTRISLTESTSPIPQQKSANPFLISLLLTGTAILFVLSRFRSAI